MEKESGQAIAYDGGLELDHSSSLIASSAQDTECAVSKLDDDVLTLVFEAGYEGFDGDEGPRSAPFSILVSHISARWRSISLRDPLLWTTINIKLSELNGLHDLYLDRSRSCPLDIRLQFDTIEPLPFETYIIHPHRCRRLIVAFDFEQSAPRVLPRLQNIRMPVLKSLAIVYANGLMGFHGLRMSPLQIFQKGAPSLTSLRINGVYNSLNFLCCKPPLERITSLQLHMDFQDLDSLPSYSDFADVLSTCSATLESLVLEGVVTSFDGFAFVENQPELRITLPSLKSLDIRYRNPAGIDEGDLGYMENISKCLVVPVLKYFALHNLVSEELTHIINMLSDPAGVPKSVHSLL
jgi:hypothetical protein